MVIAFFVVVAIGSSGQEVTEDEQLDLTGVVQAAMIQAGLPSVEVQVEDWTVILYGRVASPELKEAATRVAQAQAEVIGVGLLEPAAVLQKMPFMTVRPADEECSLLCARRCEKRHGEASRARGFGRG